MPNNPTYFVRKTQLLNWVAGIATLCGPTPVIFYDKIMKDRCKVIFYVDNFLTFLVISPHKVRNATVIPYRAFSIFATFVREVALSA